MVQKNSFKNIFLSWFKNLFTSTLDTTIISKMSNTHWHPGKRCCIPLHKKNLSKFWLIILFVTNHNASGPNVEMQPLCHKSHPWPNRLKWYSNINHDITTLSVQFKSTDIAHLSSLSSFFVTTCSDMQLEGL